MRLGYAALRLTGHVVYCLVYGVAAITLLALFALAVLVAGKDVLP